MFIFISRYRHSNGSLNPLYQDFHLQDALKDAAAHSRYVMIEADAQAQRSIPSSISQPVSSQPPRPAANQPSGGVSSGTKYCESCGAVRLPKYEDIYLKCD